MSELSLHARAALAMLQRDWLIFISYRMRLVSQLVGSFFSLTLFYYFSRLVSLGGFSGPDDYYAFAVVGLAILTVLNSTLGAPPQRMRQELVAGTFERLYLSPFGPLWSLVASLLFPFTYALFNALVTLIFAAVAFGLDVHWDTAALALPLALLGALSFMPFGVAILASVIVVKQAAAGTTWVVAGISLVAGLYFPVKLLPGWIQWTSDVQPFTPATELLRHVLVGTPLTESTGLELVKLVGFTAVLLPLSFWLVGLALAAGRRRGTLIEY